MIGKNPTTGQHELQLRTLQEQQLDGFFIQPGTKDSFLKKWKEAVRTARTEPCSGMLLSFQLFLQQGSIFVRFEGDEGNTILSITRNILSSVMCPHGYILQDVAPECIKEVHPYHLSCSNYLSERILLWLCLRTLRTRTKFKNTTYRSFAR
jgi:hypothetical protein